MFELRLQESGHAELQLAFQKLEAEFRDWHTAFEKLEPESTVVIQRRFDQEGPGWLALTRVYAAQKEKQYPGKTILRRTDALYHSFEKGGAGNVTRIEALSAEFGSNVVYGFFHQDKRPIIQISEQDELRFLSVATTEKTERVRELGFQIQ